MESTYRIQVLPRAIRALARLPDNMHQRLTEAIDALADNPRPGECRKLRGRQDWRIRVGNYRVVYEVDYTRKTVTILDIGHRRDVYR